MAALGEEVAHVAPQKRGGPALRHLAFARRTKDRDRAAVAEDDERLAFGCPGQADARLPSKGAARDGLFHGHDATTGVGLIQVS